MDLTPLVVLLGQAEQVAAVQDRQAVQPQRQEQQIQVAVVGV